MRLTPIALLMLAALPGSQGTSSTSADLPTSQSKPIVPWAGPAAELADHGASDERPPAAHLVRTSSVPVCPPAPVFASPSATFDARSFWNDHTRIYATTPIPAARGPWRAVPPDTRPIGETVTVDAVDTGERRTFGPFTARHVVTTTTTERAGESGPVSTRVRDGWYSEYAMRIGGDAAAASARRC